VKINIIGNVRALKSILALLLLGTWFPCTVHCSLEMMASAGPLPCCDNAKVGSNSSQPPASPDHCVCSWMKSGGYAFSKCAPLVSSPDDVLLVFTLSPLSEDSLTDLTLPKLIYSPPKFTTSWQFSFRTALPPRAPSVAS